ncbi:MAG TPA: choice-of-anchor L domain-containing protein [Kofleriaceae bacterium]|nr:choice-of-anchor L domain-containing protein [Kofleriaceae bacterium]
MAPASVLVLAALASACGPANDQANADCPGIDVQSDVMNCGECGHACGVGQLCVAGECSSDCRPGQTVECYEGPPATKGVGPCRAGTRRCQPDGTWSVCQGQIVPAQEVCGNGIDENCSGVADENTDLDGDGFTTCDGDCCDSSECHDPALVNPGAFDAAGNNVDDDCDGQVDNTQVTCDDGIISNTDRATDFARAMDICNEAIEATRRWGLIDAKLTLPDGTGVPAPAGHSVRPQFGALMPQAGSSFALISSGNAAAPGQTNPDHIDFQQSAMLGTESPFPTDWLAANGGSLPNTPGCPPIQSGTAAEDPVMLTLRIRVPSNAKSFKFSSNFFSAEFPEWVCSPFNDFFVVLLDSTWNDDPTHMPRNPDDKNLAFYKQPQTGNIYPVGINLASGNTGLFTECVNGTTGCFGNESTISTCVGTQQLTGTGFDLPEPGSCDTNSLLGGATGWLETAGNVVGGEIITLRIAMWDTSDHRLDSLVVLDNFSWSVDASDPGTTIGRTPPARPPVSPAAAMPVSDVLTLR